MPRLTENSAAGGASSATAQDYPENFGAPSEFAAREGRWRLAILLWLAGSAVGWSIVLGIDWSVLQAY